MENTLGMGGSDSRPTTVQPRYEIPMVGVLWRTHTKSTASF